MRDQLRIGLFVHHHLVEGTGAAGVTLRLAEELRARGHQVEVTGLELLGRLATSPLAPLLFPAAVARRVTEQVRHHELDVVDASTGDLAWLPTSVLMRPEVALLTRSHGLEPLVVAARRRGAAAGQLHLRRRYALYHGGWRLAEVRRSLQRCDQVLVLSAEEQRYVTTVLGRGIDTTTLISNGLPASMDAASPHPSTAPPGLVVLGDTSWRKATAVALEAIALAVAPRPEIPVRWLGTGVDDRTARRMLPEPLRARAEVLERYHAGDLPELLRGAEILVMTARVEGQPLTLLEAAACGLAAVATDIPGVRDVLEASGGGVLVPVDDAEAAAAAVTALLDDADRLLALRIAAQQDARGRTWPKVAADLEATYRRVLQAKAAQR